MKDRTVEMLRNAARIRRPLVLAHRGGRRLFPENSLIAFRECASRGAEGVELDVRACTSGELVVFHDETLDERTDGTGTVGELSLEEVTAARIRDHEKKLSGERVPTFEAVLEALPRDLFLNVEIKFEEGNSRFLVERVIAALEMDASRGERPVSISSFSPRVLWALRRHAGKWPIGYLVHPRWGRPPLRHLVETVIRPDALHPEAHQVSGELLFDARLRNWPVLPWTVNNPELMQDLALRGVAAIITDVPDVARKTIDALEATREELSP